jgi:hypothetical protein
VLLCTTFRRPQTTATVTRSSHDRDDSLGMTGFPAVTSDWTARKPSLLDFTIPAAAHVAAGIMHNVFRRSRTGRYSDAVVTNSNQRSVNGLELSLPQFETKTRHRTPERGVLYVRRSAARHAVLSWLRPGGPHGAAREKCEKQVQGIQFRADVRLLILSHHSLPQRSGLTRKPHI